MAERTAGMGRGLAAILASSAPEPDGGLDVREVPVELVRPNPNQPRRQFDEDALVALAGSLQERGVLQPVLVRPVAGGTYELIAGERRWRAAQLAGLEAIPAVVRAHDDSESVELALIENMARQDLNPVEEARACAMLVEELGMSRDEVGRRVGRSRVAVSNLTRLLELPDEVLDLLEQEILTEGHGRALLMARDHDTRRRLGRAAAAEGWTVRETERRARESGNPAEPPRDRRRDPHPDQLAAAGELGELFSRLTGTAVEVTTHRSGFKLTMPLASVEEAHRLAARLES